MSWKDATLRELMDTPVFEAPYIGLKVVACLAVLAFVMVIVWLIVERERHD